MAGLNAERIALEEVMNMEKRGREYYIQYSIFKQVSRVKKAVQSECEKNETAEQLPLNYTVRDRFHPEVD